MGKKRPAIHIPGKVVARFPSGAGLYKVNWLGNCNYWLQGQDMEKRWPRDGFIVQTTKACISSMMIGPEGKPSIIIDCTPEQLMNIAKEAQQSARRFAAEARKRGGPGGIFLKHLNPEVTFAFEYRAKRRPK